MENNNFMIDRLINCLCAFINNIFDWFWNNQLKSVRWFYTIDLVKMLGKYTIDCANLQRKRIYLNLLKSHSINLKQD